MNQSDDIGGEEQLIDAARAMKGTPAKAILDHIVRSADAFVAGAPQHGDMTPRTQKVISNLSGGCDFCVNRVRIDVCHMWLYFYDRCHGPANPKKRSGS